MTRLVTSVRLFALSFGLSAAVALAQTQEELERDGVVLTWVLNKYPKVVDAVLPPKLEGPVVEAQWALLLRILTAVPSEFYVRIEKDFDGPRSRGVSATVIVPEGKSLQEQLETLRRLRDSLTVEEALPMLRTKQTELNERGCPALAQLAQELKGISLPVVAPNFLMTDCSDLTFEVRQSYGSDLRFVFCGPDGGLQEHPLLSWAYRVRTRLVNECLQHRGGKTGN